MHDEKLIFSRGEGGNRANNGVIDGRSAARAAGDEEVEFYGGGSGLVRRRVEKFGADGDAGDFCFGAPFGGGPRKRGGDASDKWREDAIGEAGDDVGLEDQSGDAARDRRSDHGAGGVAADAEGGVEMVLGEDFLRIPGGGGESGEVAQEFRAADSFEAEHANGGEGQACGRDKLGFESDFCSYE